jgi:hypothetical protein
MQEQLRDNHRRKVNAEQVPGWGIDADPENDPTYPMKTHVAGEHKRYNPEQPSRPDQQSEHVEVLHSNERPNLAAVFGTTVPPSGLSGMIRRAAFNFSENSYGHWLPLMLADRVQMVEGVVEDLARGHIPNVFSEMGWKADWKYNRKAVITKVAVGSAVAVGIFALLRSRRNRSKREGSSSGQQAPGSNAELQGNGPLANRSQLDAIRTAQNNVMKDRMNSKPADSTVGTASKKMHQPAAMSSQPSSQSGNSTTGESIDRQSSSFKPGGSQSSAASSGHKAR